MATKDATQFLKEYVDKSEVRKKNLTTAEKTPTEKNTAVDGANQYIEEVTADSPDVSTVRRKLHKRAVAAGAGTDTSEERQKEREEQQRLIDEERQRREQSAAIADRIHQAGDVARSTVGPLADRVGSLPTPGGVGFLVFVLIILLFTVVVVNSHGDTRLKQLWYMLNGRATIAGRQNVTSYNPPGSPQMGTNGMQATNSSTSSGNTPGSPLPITIDPLTANGTGLPQLDTGF